MEPHQQYRASGGDQSGHHAMGHSTNHANPYSNLAIELAFDFAIMFLVMYSMIATLDHLYLNIGNVYMTLMMLAPMAALMLVFMRFMYPSRQKNLIIFALAVLLFAVGWFGMREQIGVGDKQFLRSMIPHHSGAILMCQKAKLTDPKLKQLCQDIIVAQKAEIAQMEAMLKAAQ